jgi:hypothetical protein
MGSRTLAIGLALAAMLAASACTDRTADAAKRNADAAVDAGKVAADKVAEVASATGAAVSDGWITAKLNLPTKSCSTAATSRSTPKNTP